MELRTRVLAVLLAMVALVTSCNKEPEVIAEVDVTPSSLTFTSVNPAAKNLSILCNVPWTAECDASWVKLSTVSGDGDGVIAVSVTPNELPEGQRAKPREAKIVIIAKDKKMEVSVVQSGEEQYFAVDGKADLSSDGGTVKVKIDANVSYKVSIDVSWIKQIDMKAIKSEVLSFTAEPNPEHDVRTGTITITPSEGEAKTVVVTEAANPILSEGVVDNFDGTFTLTFTLPQAVSAGSADIIPLEGDTRTPVSVTLDETATSIKAVAPKSNSYAVVVPSGLATINGDDKLVVSVPATQDGGLAVIKAAITTTANMAIALTPLTAEVSYNNDVADLASTQLSGQLFEQISGDIAVQLTDSGLQTAVVEGTGTNSITVTKKGESRIQVLPVSMANGLFLKPFTSNGDALTGVFADGPITNAAGSTYSIGSISSKQVKSYDISDFESFKALVGQVNLAAEGDEEKALVQNDTIATLKGWRLHGTTVNILSDITFTESVKIEFTNLPMKVTFVLNGNSNAFDGNESCRLLTLGNQVSAAFNKLTVKRGSVDGNGAGMCLGSGSSGDLDVTFKECVFEGNKVPNTANGGALAVMKAKVVAENCTFKGNYARNGAAIYSYSDSAEAIFKECHFLDNVTYNTGGSSNNSGGRQVYENCEFKGNYTETGAGGAIHANATGCTVSLNKCTFTDCHTSDKAGAISLQTADITIEDCTFEKCYAKDGGALYLQSDSSPKVTINNSSFTECYATYEGGVFQQRTGELNVTKSVFTKNYTSGKALSGVGHIWGKSKANFTECEFSGNIGAKEYWGVNNNATGGGVMAISYADNTFKDCIFDSNCGSTASVFDIRKDSFVKADGCVFINNQAGSRGTVKLSDNAVFFADDCAFVNNSLKTSDWGIIIHGGNPAVTAINNSTFYNNTPGTTTGNSVVLNNDGSILLTNSTVIGEAALASIRNTNASNAAAVTIANDIIINTHSNGNAFRGDAMNVVIANGGHNIVGPNSNIANFVSSDTDVTNADITTLVNGSWDATSYHYIWDGPALSTVTSDDIKTVMANSFKPTVTCNSLTSEQQSNVGNAFVTWLDEIKAFEKRNGSAMWPGSYEKIK